MYYLIFKYLNIWQYNVNNNKSAEGVASNQDQITDSFGKNESKVK